MGTDASASFRRLFPAVITWSVGIFLCAWLSWCALFQFLGVTTEAEIIRTQEEKTSFGRRRWTRTVITGVVRYVDDEGRTHSKKVRLAGEATVGQKVPVRYLRSRPDECRRDDFWGIWGYSVLAAAIFIVIVNPTGLGWSWGVGRAAHRKPTGRTTP
jgi:hypothetical protein